MNQFSRTVGLLLMAGVCAFPLQAAQPYFKTAKGFGPGFYVGTTQPLVLDLSGYIEATPGTDTNVVYVSTGAGGFGMQLLPGNAPKTVANFLSYVRSGAYGNTFVHRSVKQFIIQTGGYTLDDALRPIKQGDPIKSEFSVKNTRGTVAMALVGTNPDSATSQWFINTADNTATLDDTNVAGNPRFTVFARVLGNGMSNVVDKIDSASIYNLSPNLYFLPWNQAFGETPLKTNNLNFSSFYNVRVSEIPFFAYSSDPSSFSTKLEGKRLKVKFEAYPTNSPTSLVTITVGATDTNGLNTNASFAVVPSTPGTQRIAFPQIPQMVYTTNTTNTFTITNFPSSSSGIPVTVSIRSGPVKVATNASQSNGITSETPLSLTGTGTAVLVASTLMEGQAAYNYKPAVPVSISVPIKPRGQTIGAFPPVTDHTFGEAPFVVSPPVSDSQLPVKVSVKSGPARIANNLVTLTGAGNVILAANQGGDAIFASASEVTTNIVVGKASQTISFPEIGPRQMTDRPFIITLPTASSRLPVTTVVSGPAGLTGRKITLTGGNGLVILVASQAGNSNYKPIALTNTFRVSGNGNNGSWPPILP